MTESYYGDGNSYRGTLCSDSDVRTIKLHDDQAMHQMFGDLHGSFMVTAAIRYALPRKTAAPWCVVNATMRAWRYMLPEHRDGIIKEVKEALERGNCGSPNEWEVLLVFAENVRL